MGTWGYKIFQNDDACDIRDTYKEKLVVGISDDDAEDAVIEEFAIDSDSNLWIPLGMTQWELGRLSNRVKVQALSAIELELNSLKEQWKPSLISKRKEELLSAQQKLCGKIPKKKTLKMPSWAYRCPWKVGNVLQYKVEYPREDNPISGCYVMLLVCGVAETPTGKIPCECFSVRLYNWYSRIEPVMILEEILSHPPELVDFISRSGKKIVKQTILPSNDMIEKGAMKLISQLPLSHKEIDAVEVSSPMNSTFDELISRTLAQCSD